MAKVLTKAEAAGLDMEIGRDRVAEMVVEERIVLLKPSNKEESGMTAFSIIATAESGSFPRGTLEEALSMNLFGSQTDKGHIGLFGDSLFFSMDIDIEGITPEQLTEKLLAFSRFADELKNQLAAESSEDDDDALLRGVDEIGGDDEIGGGNGKSVDGDNSGLGTLGDFMQV